MAGGFEGENPTRRYKWFRPRQAARGALIDTSGSNHPTGGLYNNSTGAQLLIVRDAGFLAASSSSAIFGLAYVQGQPGTLGGQVTPFYPAGGSLPGQLWSADLASSYTPDIFLPELGGASGYSAWQHDFPLAILPPGWSLALASSSAFSSAILTFVWEAIYPEELDWYF